MRTGLISALAHHYCVSVGAKVLQHFEATDTSLPVQFLHPFLIW